MRPRPVAALVLACMAPAAPPAQALESERSASVRPGERARIWSGANYGQRCRSAGPPVFKVVSAPRLGELSADEAPHVVPRGERCGGNSYTGLRIWYKAGMATGVDSFSYTIEFPHEASNPRPSKGPQPVTATITIKME
jgi:hypothetical protein